MELSPLAKEKLAKIGELSEEEKAGIRNAKVLAELLARYFTNKLTPEGLWKELQDHKNAGKGFMLRDAQLRLLEAMGLTTENIDFDKLSRGILAVETLKEGGDYAGLEHDLKLIENLRRQYREERDKAYAKIKADVERQVRMAAQQLARQAAAKGATIDVQSSVDASAKASPEWKSFITKHENYYSLKLKEQIARLHRRLSVPIS